MCIYHCRMEKAIACFSVLVFFSIADGSPQSQNIAGQGIPDAQTRLLNPEEKYVFYESANGSFKLHRKPATWRDARHACNDEGAELASPDNRQLWIAMTKILQTSVQSPPHIFTGINDMISRRSFNSVAGTPLSEMPAGWAPGEPRDALGLPNCLLMMQNGQLLNSKCHVMHSYICYKRYPVNQDICGIKGNGYEYWPLTGSCYKYHRSALPWRHALASCHSEGGHLVIVDSTAESSVLVEIMRRKTKETVSGAYDQRYVLVGFRKYEDGQWATIFGDTLTAVGFAQWSPGQPDDLSGKEELCGSIFENGLFNDIHCTFAYAYICEIIPKYI